MNDYDIIHDAVKRAAQYRIHIEWLLKKLDEEIDILYKAANNEVKNKEGL